MIQITNWKRFVLMVAIFFIAIPALAIWWLLRVPAIEKTGEFVIEEGQSAAGVWGRLVNQGYISGELGAKYYGWRADAATRIQAGTYQLETGESLTDVISRFVGGDAKKYEISITFPEGFTLEEMAVRAEEKGIGTAEEFIQVAKPENFADQFPFLAELPPGRTLEGYLFPDTYRLFPDDEPRDLILRMLTVFDQKVIRAGLGTEAAAEGERTLDEAIIMASIIEREVILDEDMALVSGVLWKRLDEQIGLGADATVRYVLKKWNGALTVDDLAVDSPYNTRRYRDLPPGPISNPGMRAIMAAVRPQQSDFYYYLSARDGKTIFSKTNEEHNVNKEKYLQ